MFIFKVRVKICTLSGETLPSVSSLYRNNNLALKGEEVGFRFLVWCLIGAFITV